MLNLALLQLMTRKYYANSLSKKNVQQLITKPKYDRKFLTVFNGFTY